MKTRLTYHGIVLAKKNRHIISKNGAIIPDTKARANEQDIMNQIASQLEWQDAMKSQTERMLEANRNGWKYGIDFKIWAGNAIRRDLDNQTSTLLDALVKIGALPDDSTKFLERISVQHMGIDKHDPHVEIEITRTEAGGTE